MNAQQKKAAVTKYSPLKTAGAERKEISTTIQKEIKGISAADLKSILDQIFAADASNTAANASSPTPPAKKGGGSGGEKLPKKNTAANASSPNDALDLKGFNYKNLTGASFRKYVELVGDRGFVEIDEETGKPIPVPGSLPQDGMFDFVQMKARPIIKDRFPGMPDTPKDYVGLQTIDDTPIHQSRMAIKQAHELNAQILNQHSIAGHGKYYFLKKD